MRKKRSILGKIVAVILVLLVVVFAFGMLNKCKEEKNAPKDDPKDETVQISFDKSEVVF